MRDIYYVVNKVYQFMHTPTEGHWATVKCLLWYLKGMTLFGLHFTHGSSLSLHGFTDADWANSINDRKSIKAYILFLGTTPILWKFDKQRIVARSFIGDKYKALTDDIIEVFWLHYLLWDLCFSPSFVTIIWCDNLGATYLSANSIFHAHTKHVEVDYHFVHDQVAKKEIHIHFISSTDQLADVLFKPLPHSTFVYLRSKLHVDTTFNLRGCIIECVIL